MILKKSKTLSTFQGLTNFIYTDNSHFLTKLFQTKKELYYL